MDAGKIHWLNERKSGLGGTDGAAILGLSKYATGYDVWCQKLGMVPSKDETPAMRWGHLLEPVVAQAYCERTGRSVWNPDQLMRHSLHDFIIGTPDRLVIGAKRGLECKTSAAHMADVWGPDGSDVIPEHYLVQVCHYMALTDYDVWDVAVLIGGSDFRIYTIHRDRDFEQRYIDALVTWWHRHIVGGEQPEITGETSIAETLTRRFVRQNDDISLDASIDDESLMHQLDTIKKSISALELDEQLITNKLKSRMGDASSLNGTSRYVTWRSPKPTVKVDWHQVADELMRMLPDDKSAGIVRKHTQETTAGRRFLLRTRKDGMDG